MRKIWGLMILSIIFIITAGSVCAQTLTAPMRVEGDFMIYFNEDMIDFSQPVHFQIADKGELDVMFIPEESWLNFTTFERGDPNYQFEAAVSYSWLTEHMN